MYTEVEIDEIANYCAGAQERYNDSIFQAVLVEINREAIGEVCARITQNFREVWCYSENRAYDYDEEVQIQKTLKSGCNKKSKSRTSAATKTKITA